MKDLIDRNLIGDLVDSNGNVHYEDIMNIPSLELPPVQPVDKDINVSCKDAIDRQAAIDYCYQLINVEHQQGSDEMNYGQVRVDQTETILHHLEIMPSAQPEDCDTCKHGYFGDEQCNSCRVRYPSHYERRTDECTD